MKKISLKISLIFCFLFLNILSVNALENKYYNKKNAPEFYGLTKAIIQKGDSFSINNSKYRIFARDFEDGDLTQSIIVISNNVDTSNVGKYHIKYEVIDSDGNKTTLDVLIEVIDDLSKGRYYERTLYSLPSVSNMSLAGTNRGNYHDRQMLGFYMKKDSKISVKKISGDNNLELTYLNNDSATEKNFTINNEYTDISVSYDGVPFIKTNYESEEPVVIGISEKDSNVYSVPYYYNGDNESDFFDYWKQLTDSYAIVESEDLTVLIPYYDQNKLVNYYKNCFTNLDAFFSYWHQVMNQYDEYLGLSYNPKDAIDQNVKTKYFVKANKHGAGSAYYAWDHVGINSDSVASFFEINWGGLHEIGHGYQGSLKSDLDQGEVSNNILGYYVQMNKLFYPYSANWLGKIDEIEDSHQSVRISGGSYFDLSVSGKLYFAINLLDYKDSQKTYAEINKIWRRSLKNKDNISTQDAYALAYYNLYKINIVPYFEAWKISVSSQTKETVSDGKIPSMLYDIAKDNVSLIKKDLRKDGKYSLVSNEEIKKYSLTGNLNITLNIDNFSELKNKKIIIKNENYQKEILIKNKTISLKDIPIGTYQIILPVPKNNIYNYTKFNYVTISNNETNSLKFNYQIDNLMDLTNDSKIEFRGLGNWLFADITFKNKMLNITTYAGKPHSYFNDQYAKLEIYDLNNQVIYSKEYLGNQNYAKKIEEVPYQYGYKIVISHKEGNGRLIINNKLLDENDKNLVTLSNQANTYIIGKYGLYQEGQNYYQNYLNKIDRYVLKLEQKLSEEEIANKNLYIEEKRQLLLSLLKLKEQDKNNLLEKYRYIYNGSSPKLVNSKIEIKQYENLDLYNLLKATDVEDGIYNLTSQNFKFDYNLVTTSLSGEYQIPYELKDSDDNITSGIINLKVLKSEIKNNNQDKENSTVKNNSVEKNNKNYNSDNKTTKDKEKNNQDLSQKNKKSDISKSKKQNKEIVKNINPLKKYIIFLTGISLITILSIINKIKK